MRWVIIVAIIGLAIGFFVVRHGGRIETARRIAPEGAVHADTIVRFAWHAVPGAVRYTVDVARPDGISVASAATLGDTTIDVSTLALTRGVDYRWTITATDARGHVSRSAPVGFSVRK